MESSPGRRSSTRERRDQRAERILDVTSDLVLRWGYRKTTLNDIAREAEVAKGTLFLHWRNRDALFLSLLRRERLRLYDALLHELGEPGGIRPVAIEPFFADLVREILARPLIPAVLIGDEQVLGRLVRQKRSSPTTAGTRHEFLSYLKRLRDLGLIRNDLDAEELLATCTATFAGFMFTALRLPPFSEAMADLPDEARCAQLCGEALGRVLRPSDQLAATTDQHPGGVAGNAEYAFTQATSEFLERARTVARNGYRASLDEVRAT